MNEDSDNFHQSRNKTMVFTLEERKLLLKLVNLYYDVLNNKKVDSASTQLKNNAWIAIHKLYLENTELIKLPRTPQQLKRCWENMKCKAKKGDPMSVKLLKWGEVQYKLLKGRNEDLRDKKKVSVSTELFEEDSDVELKHNYIKEKNEEPENLTSSKLEEAFIHLKESLENSDCKHCLCDKSERSASIQLLLLQKKHLEELHQLKLQLTKEKIQFAKELHKLSVHEMTLKIENERRKAVILDKELEQL